MPEDQEPRLVAPNATIVLPDGQEGKCDIWQCNYGVECIFSPLLGVTVSIDKALTESKADGKWYAKNNNGDIVLQGLPESGWERVRAHYPDWQWASQEGQ